MYLSTYGDLGVDLPSSMNIFFGGDPPNVLFESCRNDAACMCRLHVFADDPCRFFEVNVVEVCALSPGALTIRPAGLL